MAFRNPILPAIENIAGNWYSPPVSNSTGLTLIENRIYYLPQFSAKPGAVDRVAVNVTVAAADATFAMRAAIYTNRNSHPGNLLGQMASPLAIGTGTGIQSGTIAASVPAGPFWTAVIFNRNGGAGSLAQVTRTSVGPGVYMSSVMIGGSDMTTGYHCDMEDVAVATWGTYSFASVAAAPARSTNQCPIIAYRAA